MVSSCLKMSQPLLPYLSGHLVLCNLALQGPLDLTSCPCTCCPLGLGPFSPPLTNISCSGELQLKLTFLGSLPQTPSILYANTVAIHRCHIA